jgi:hypothetical protein
MALQLPRETYRAWSGGVVTALRAEDVPKEASPRGHNSTLVGVGQGRAVPAKRRGAAILTLAAEALGTLSPLPDTLATAHSQHVYRRLTSGDYTYTHLAVQKETGDLYGVTAAGASTVLGAAAFGVNGLAPGWATFKNIAFGFAGPTRKKVVDISGTLTVQNLGLLRPPARTVTAFNWDAAFSGSGVMTGDYEVALTFWNDNAQLESSLSDGYTPATAASDQLTLTWATSPDTQITHVRVHIRKTGLNVNFLRVTAGTGYVAGKGVPIATATTVLDLSDDAILAYLASPDSLEHNPPAVDSAGTSSDDLLGGLIHGGRLLTWSPTGIYYSQFDEPEQFDPESFEPISPDDGQELVTCHKPNDDVVLVFKRGSLYGIFGNDPNTWSVELIDPSVGCVAPQSIITIEGTTYWWSVLGPMAWNGSGPPLQIGYQRLRDTVDPSATNPAAWSGIVTHVQPSEQKVVFWVPEAGSLQNSMGLPFNYRLGVFESDLWNPFPVASAVTGEDADGRPVVILGGYYGRLYQWWAADVDGAQLANTALDAYTLAGTVASATTTVITMAGVVALHASMVGYPVILADAEGTVVRRRITAVSPSGSADTATLTVAALDADFTPTAWTVSANFTLSGTIAAAADEGSYARLSVEDAVFDPDLAGHAFATVHTATGESTRRRIVAVGSSGTQGYVDLYPVLDYNTADALGLELTIASPNFAWDTPWSDSGDAFAKKRYMHSHMAGVCNQGSATTHLDIFTSYNLDEPSRTRSYTIAASGAVWDVDQFDLATFGGGEGRSTFRTAVGRVANSYRMRVRNHDPNRQFVLLAMGMDCFGLSDRR